MRVVPAVLDRVLVLGFAVLPLVGLLASLSLEGDAGLLSTAVIVVGAVIYAAVAWLLGARRELANQLGAVEEAPEDAHLEALGRTAAGALLRTLPIYALAVVAGFVNVLAPLLAVAGGIGLVAALGARELRRWERTYGGRLVRGSPGSLLRF